VALMPVLVQPRLCFLPLVVMVRLRLLLPGRPSG
jgi:hypothetical protein